MLWWLLLRTRTPLVGWLGECLHLRRGRLCHVSQLRRAFRVVSHLRDRQLFNLTVIGRFSSSRGTINSSDRRGRRGRTHWWLLLLLLLRWRLNVLLLLLLRGHLRCRRHAGGSCRRLVRHYRSLVGPLRLGVISGLGDGSLLWRSHLWSHSGIGLGRGHPVEHLVHQRVYQQLDQPQQLPPLEEELPLAGVRACLSKALALALVQQAVGGVVVALFDEVLV